MVPTSAFSFLLLPFTLLMKLRTIIFLILLSLGILPILTLVAINLAGHIERHDTVEKERVIAGTLSDFNTLNARIENLKKSLIQAASMPETVARATGVPMPLMSRDDHRRLGELMIKLLNDDLNIAAIQVLDLNGEEKIRLVRNGGKKLAAVGDRELKNLEDIPAFWQGLKLNANEVIAAFQESRPGDPETRPENLLLITPVFGNLLDPLGIVLLSIDLDVFLQNHENAFWVDLKGRILHLPPGIIPAKEEAAIPALQTETNAFEVFRGLEPRLTGHEPFHWERENLLISWLPMIFNGTRNAPLWIGVPVDRSAAEIWKKSLVENITWIVLTILVIISVIASLIARKIDRIKVAILTGLDNLLNRKEENVEFHWTGPREVVNLAEELTVLARQYLLTRQKQKEIEQESRLQQQQLVQADKMISLGVLIAGVAHEINNPNSIAMLNTSMLQRSWESARPILEQYYRESGDFLLAGLSYSEMRGQIPRLFKELEESSKRIRNIVQDLKDYARQDTSRHQETLDLNEVAQAAVRLNQNKLSKSTDHFETSYQPALPPIRGNRQRLEQVIINLLQNSCEALESPAGKLMVSTRHNPGDNTVELEILDQGCGIPEHTIHRITDPFFTTKRSRGGTGLGLSVSAGIIKEHHGSMQFFSKPGQGTIARLTFPVQAADAS